MSLQLRIGLIVTSMMLIFMCSLVAMDVRHSRAAIAEEIHASNLIAVNLLRQIDAAFIHGDPAGFLAFLERTGRIRANDIALYDAQGRLRYQSPPSQYKPGREAPRWYARLVEPALPVTQLPLDGATLQVRAHASRAVLDAWDELRGQLLTALALLVLSQLALLWWVRRSTRPFALIEHALQDHAAGRTDTRLPRLSGKEARSIARRFNEMADALASLHRQQLAWAQAQAYQQAQRHYTYRLQADRELERKQLAATLHDEFSQSLTALRSVSHVLGMAQVDQQRQRDAVALIQHGVERMQLVLRDLLSSLRPAALDGLGLAMAVDDLLAQQRQFHPQLQLRFHGRALPPLPEVLQIHAYRLVQEACTNAIRHGACTTISVSLRACAAALHLRIADDGCGRADAITPRAGHFGVIGMVERAQALGGSVRWLARPGPGVVVLARLPLSPTQVQPQEGRA